ncbi:alpha/beta hydrolase [Paenibacillus sp. NPDC057934]|uniref:alpha/beta hydrolase n=1 Tax=Paenibacillus sp. NPDC057934 TaxID=3346282 RepID=UPI0036D7BDCE
MDSCLFIHGFTGGEHEIAPLSRYMEQHHYRSRTFTLKGHGGTRADLLKTSRHDWQQSAEDELNTLLESNKRVHLIGFSTGALIASHLSVRYKERVHSLTLLSTPVFPLNLVEMFKTLGNPVMLKQYISKIRTTPPKATREFQRLVRESFEIYPHIETPTLIVQGKRDHLVKTRSASYLHHTIPSTCKQMLIAGKSGHMLCHDDDKDETMREVLQFIQSTGTER